MPTGSDEQVLAAARMLVEQGARSVLVTLEARGALLLQAARWEGHRLESFNRIAKHRMVACLLEH